MFGAARGEAGNEVPQPCSPGCLRLRFDSLTSGLSFPLQEPTLGRQVQRAVSMATLAALCEAVDRHPVLQLDSPDAEPLDRFLSAFPLNQMLKKPRSEEQNSCVHPLENGR